MIKRKIYKTLLSWKAEIGRKPLLIRGARQIGKTYTVNEFGLQEFETLITLNFERNPEYCDIFTTYDPAEIMERILLFTGKSVTVGSTLIFLDEIQDCPNAIMALRYFYEEKPELHLIGAGSLLEFALSAEGFRMPVGRVQYLYMFPLSFGEFMAALSEGILYRHVLEVGNLSSLPAGLHDKLLSLVRKYFILGGMPQVVNAYIQTGDMLQCQKIQHAIIDTYKDDFGKYARKAGIKYVQKVFAAIPALIGQKFIYAHVDKTIKSRELKQALLLLETAGVVHRIQRTSGAGLPLEAGVNSDYFKVIFLDIGLVHAMNGIQGETIRAKDMTAIFKGAVAEQFVGQEIIVNKNNYRKPSLFYWARAAKNSTAELDYLLEVNGKIIPIEIKFGASGRLKSMLLFLKAYDIKKGLKISQAPYKKEENITAIPFYAIERLLRQPSDNDDFI